MTMDTKMTWLRYIPKIFHLIVNVDNVKTSVGWNGNNFILFNHKNYFSINKYVIILYIFISFFTVTYVYTCFIYLYIIYIRKNIRYLRLVFFKCLIMTEKPFPLAGTLYCTRAAFCDDTSLRLGRRSQDSTSRSSFHASAGHTWPFSSQPSTHWGRYFLVFGKC